MLEGLISSLWIGLELIGSLVGTMSDWPLSLSPLVLIPGCHVLIHDYFAINP